MLVRIHPTAISNISRLSTFCAYKNTGRHQITPLEICCSSPGGSSIHAHVGSTVHACCVREHRSSCPSSYRRGCSLQKLLLHAHTPADSEAAGQQAAATLKYFFCWFESTVVPVRGTHRYDAQISICGVRSQRLRDNTVLLL